MSKYARTIESLQAAAIRHWPQELRERVRESSVLEALIDTQDEFLAVLRVATRTPMSWLSVLDQSKNLSKRLFLKHLMVISDVGGEALNKLPPLSRYIPAGELVIPWNQTHYRYKFKKINRKCLLNNSALHMNENSLRKNKGKFTEKMEDVAMLILYGSDSIGNTLPPEIQEKCLIGSLIGKDEELCAFVRQNYIRVSRQLAGATSNALGQVAQQFVCETLSKKLPAAWEIKSNGVLPGVSHTDDGSETIFDVVVKSPNNKYCGIEVSFQVTTNSVIERKSRESDALHSACSGHGHKIAYVIDGVGNIDIRKQAVRTICSHSDCTVAFSASELETLVSFLTESLS